MPGVSINVSKKRHLRDEARIVAEIRRPRLVRDSDWRMLMKAIAVSRISEYGHGKSHGAVIVKNGNVLGVGVNAVVNRFESLSDEHVKRGHTVHAEQAALDALRKVNLRGTTVYVARTNESGQARNSAPCSRCRAALIARGVKRAVFTADGAVKSERY